MFSVSNSKSAVEARLGIIIDLVNQAMVERAITVEYKHSGVVNYYKKKKMFQKELTIGINISRSGFEDSLEYQKVKHLCGNIYEIQLDLKPGCKTANNIPVFKQLQKKNLAKKKNFYFSFVDFKNAFDQVPEDVHSALQFTQYKVVVGQKWSK